MIVIQVTAKAKHETTDRVRALLEEVVSEARLLTGCRHYDWYISPRADTRETFIYAEFESDDAFAAYRTGPVVKKIVEQLIPLLEGRPSFKHFRATIIEHG